jgi:hypothetical protein
MTAFWTEADFDDHELVEVVRDAKSGLTIRPISVPVPAAPASGIMPNPPMPCAMRFACRAG